MIISLSLPKGVKNENIHEMDQLIDQVNRKVLLLTLLHNREEYNKEKKKRVVDVIKSILCKERDSILELQEQ